MLKRLNRSLLPWPKRRLNADDRPIGAVCVFDAIVRAIGPLRPLTRAPITSMSELLQALCC